MVEPAAAPRLSPADEADPELSFLLGELERANLSPTVEHRQAFALYLDLLREWGSRINLVSSRDLVRVGRRHVLESLNLAVGAIPLAGRRLADLGSGAGFPGLPLSIWEPDLEALLVESIGKKAQFLARVIKKLQLTDRVRVICERAELAGHGENERGAHDLVTMRALGPLSRSVRWAAPFLEPGGLVVAYKGTVVEPELERARQAMQECGLVFAKRIRCRWGKGSLVVLRRRHVAGRQRHS